MPNELDSPWKDVLDKYFPAFMELLFPDAYADIDWSIPPVALDAELQKIVRDAATGRRLADKLVRVKRQSGEDLVVLVHTEVQGQYDPEFAERMFTYHYRIRDRYRQPVVSLAVFGDQKPKWRPNRLSYELWGCSLDFRFPVVKLSDFGNQWDRLQSDDNPFATVVMTHTKATETKDDPHGRKLWKMRLTRNMYERGFEKQTILDIFRIIDWMMTLPPEIEKQFENELQTFEKERKMPYLTAIERNAIEKGKKQGIEQGIEQGLQRGLQRGECKTLLRILTHRFGEVPPLIRKTIESAEVEQLESWVDKALDAPSIEDVFANGHS
ncbi:MAG: Rpn family recombination-promoting nuclease/putative transposase [Verrucomicrobiota bacterium]